MRIVILLGLVALLSACGGKRRAPVAVTPSYQAAVPFASGPIQAACVQADRKAANPRLCGCIQAVANQKLTSKQQRQAVTFFRDPHQAQVARQEGSRQFWTTYKAWAASSKRVCNGA